MPVFLVRCIIYVALCEQNWVQEFKHKTIFRPLVWSVTERYMLKIWIKII